MAEKPKTIVLLSGGMNSAVMLYEILTFKKAQILDCMIFDSFQPSEDIICARMLCEKVGVPFSIWDLEPAPIMTTTNLDSPKEITKEFSADLRNTCFMQMLVAAVRYAKLAGADTVTAGFCHEDIGVPMVALTDIGHGAAAILDHRKLRFNFPMWDLEKWEIFKLAENLNRVAEVLDDTYSCLKHDADIQHPWGHGCGSCDGCVRRWRAWEEHLERKKA
jgi:7-cyano-7-deazaguanine synthase in queuosine biosynthesis